MTRLVLTRVSPLATVQDAGRSGTLRHGVSASGPMDRAAFDRAATALPSSGTSAIEFTRAGIDFTVFAGVANAAFLGGDFKLVRNGRAQPWPSLLRLDANDTVEITPGAWGNYGYVRFDREIDVPVVLGSRATNLTAGLGGLAGRALRVDDALELLPTAGPGGNAALAPELADSRPIRIMWGLHADLFPAGAREAFVDKTFRISPRMDRMAVWLDDPHRVLAGSRILSLVSDAVVAGDIQVLGDGNPIVLMRDHPPTGGYPRIATVIAADLSRFAQLRPGTEVRFTPVSLANAQAATTRPP